MGAIEKELNTLESQLSYAIALAATAHHGEVDKGGAPYILHPLRVMHMVRHLGYKHMIVAVLHDVVEDTVITHQDLAEAFDTDICYAINLLDFRNKDYMKQIELIAQNTLAKEVKMRDLEHNSKITRLKGLDEKSDKRMRKYHEAYTYLKNN